MIDNAEKREAPVVPALPLSTVQIMGNTMRPVTPKQAKHQTTMSMTQLSRSTGRSDKARRAQGTRSDYAICLFGSDDA